MQLKHIEHPEDTILTGDLSAINWFTLQGKVSLKIDGCPAIVWGTNPENDKFFVGTKSVFNKVKKMICHSHEEIDILYAEKPDLANKLHLCFDNLVRTENIYQGDLIGIGGDDYYQPNTIGYLFPYKIEHNIIIAPHTIYSECDDLRNAESSPLQYLPWSDTKTCKFVQPKCWAIDEDFDEIVSFAKQMSCMCEFLTDKQSCQVQQQLNSIIRAGLDIDDLTFEALAFANKIDINVLRLWALVKSIKMDMLFLMRNNGPDAFIDNKQCGGEGYVKTNEFGMFKLVNREGFSHANFNNNRFEVSL